MGATDYGPLNKISEVEARYKTTEAKDHRAKTVEYRGKKYTVSKAYAKEFSRQETEKEEKIPLKFRKQAAIMEKSKDIASGSFSVAKEMAKPSYGWPIGLVFSLPPAIVGTIAFGIQKISESRFGKTIDMAGDNMNEKSYANYINHLSKSRIDKNFKREVIDEETSNILKVLKDMTGKVQPKKSELRLLKNEKAKLESKLLRLEKKEKPSIELLKISPDDLKAKAALKTISTEKEEVKKIIEESKKQIDSLTQEIGGIETKYSEQLKGFQAKRDLKLQEVTNVSNGLITEETQLRNLKDQRKQDKKLLDLEKNINKKYKSNDGHVNAQSFFNDKYKAYLNNCTKHEKSPVTQEEFIKKYYSKKGIS